jgi:hypothetical protein
MRKWRYSSIILNLGTDGGDWSASCPCHFTPGDITTSTQWIGSWVDHRAGLDTVGKNRLLLPGTEPQSSIPQSSHYILLWRFSNYYNFTKLYLYVSVQWSCDVSIILHYILWCHYLWTNSHLLKRIIHLHWFTGKIWELEKKNVILKIPLIWQLL